MMPKILLWDLETSNLNADFGYILCAGVKEYGSKAPPKVYSVTDFKGHSKDPTNDRELVKQLAEILVDADVWVTWFGTYFDVPYLNSRLLFHGFKPLPKILHIDGWMTAKRRMKLHSNRLASVTEFLGCAEKTPLSGPVWIRASAGHKPSIQYVKKHCAQDVLVLEQAYDKMLPLIVNHPNVKAISGQSNEQMCPRCGSFHLQKRGVAYTNCGSKQRYQCKACGGWATGKSTVHRGIVRPE